MLYGFGSIAIVAILPTIVIQIMGIRYQCFVGKSKKSSKRDCWRPAQDPRERDRFWDPNYWQANDFQDTMEAPRLPKGKQKHVTWEDAE